MDQEVALQMTGKGSLSLWLIFATALFSSCSYRFYPAACDLPLPGYLHKQTVLDSSVNETSGLLYLGDTIWSFNDSGGEPVLYGLDPQTGKVISKVFIGNATNTDWEAIAADDRYVYVADVGNNFATRDTVLIFRVLKSGLRSGEKILPHDGIISVSFRDKVEQNANGYSSHDCEALLAHGDSLYLFSKNWVEESTSVYIIPSVPGHYNVKRRYSYEARILVTGADLRPADKQVSLVGYRDYFPIVISYKYGRDPGQIECGGRARIYPLKRGRQVEGLCYGPEGDIFISAERTIQRQMLFKLGPLVH